MFMCYFFYPILNCAEFQGYLSQATSLPTSSFPKIVSYTYSALNLFVSHGAFHSGTPALLRVFKCLYTLSSLLILGSCAFYGVVQCIHNSGILRDHFLTLRPLQAFPTHLSLLLLRLFLLCSRRYSFAFSRMS